MKRSFHLKYASLSVQPLSTPLWGRGTCWRSAQDLCSTLRQASRVYPQRPLLSHVSVCPDKCRFFCIPMSRSTVEWLTIFGDAAVVEILWVAAHVADPDQAFAADATALEDKFWNRYLHQRWYMLLLAQPVQGGGNIPSLATQRPFTSAGSRHLLASWTSLRQQDLAFWPCSSTTSSKGGYSAAAFQKICLCSLEIAVSKERLSVCAYTGPGDVLGIEAFAFMDDECLVAVIYAIKFFTDA